MMNELELDGEILEALMMYQAGNLTMGESLAKIKAAYKGFKGEILTPSKEVQKEVGEKIKARQMGLKPRLKQNEKSYNNSSSTNIFLFLQEGISKQIPGK